MNNFKCLKCNKISTSEQWDNRTKEYCCSYTILSIEDSIDSSPQFWCCPKCKEEVGIEDIKMT